jgi:hypothetical protein
MMNAWIKVLMKVTKTVSLHEILEKIPPGKSSVFYGMQKQWDWTKHHEQTVKQSTWELAGHLPLSTPYTITKTLAIPYKLY